MSLGATGTIAKTITFGKWKGINTARQRVTPSNPRTAAQTAQRVVFSYVVAFWRSFMIGTGAKAAWNKDASASGKPQSGFNAFTSSATKIGKQTADAGIVTGRIYGAADNLVFGVADLDSGSLSSEAGNFTLNVGAAQNQMLDSYDSTCEDGQLNFDISADYSAGAVIYCQVIKTAGTAIAAKRSGIFTLTLG